VLNILANGRRATDPGKALFLYSVLRRFKCRTTRCCFLSPAAAKLIGETTGATSKRRPRLRLGIGTQLAGFHLLAQHGSDAPRNLLAILTETFHPVPICRIPLPSAECVAQGWDFLGDST
jgi:hypothetical protein